MVSYQRNGKTPQIGEVYLMKFSGSGSEQVGWRPGLVFQNNVGNSHSPNVIALPLTSSIKKTSQPTHEKRQYGTMREPTAYVQRQCRKVSWQAVGCLHA